MNKFRLTISALAIAIFMLAFASMAQAQATRTWVSGVGDDANPCSRTAPCKTFAGAISKTAPSGEISCLDPGGFGAVTITKGMTINGEGTLGGILNSITNGVIVNAGTGDNVTLRNISINAPLNGLDGVKIFQAKSVNIENCTITGQAIGVEVAVTAGSNVNLSINGTTIKNNSAAGVRVDNSTGLARVSITNSVITNSGFGVHAKRNSRVEVSDSTLSFNTVGVNCEANGVQAIVFVKSCNIANNTSHGIQAGGGGATTTSRIQISNNIINNNAGAGVSIQANGFVDTFLDNAINFNNPDGCVGCANVTGTLN